MNLPLASPCIPVLLAGNIPEREHVSLSMKHLALALVFLALSTAAWGQTEGNCSQTLSAPLNSGAELTIDSRSMGLEIVATDGLQMRISCKADEPDTARRIHLKMTGNTSQMRLDITGDSIHSGNQQVRIEVPRRTSLVVRMPAGQINIDNVEGDKDCNLNAGQITISAHSWNYRAVDAAVEIGQVNAAAYKTDKSGFFNHFQRKNAGGEFALRAHVMTGQIELLGPKQRANGTTEN